MVILGHVSAEMSLRYARLFDSTVRAEYERALSLAKSRLGPLPTPDRGTDEPDQDHDWRTTPTIKTALAGGYCLRAPAQGPCAYANLCEHCPAYRTTIEHIPVLTAQRDDAAALAQDATDRGWDAETERHLRLISRLNTHIEQAATRRTPA